MFIRVVQGLKPQFVEPLAAWLKPRLRKSYCKAACCLIQAS
jgi:hypothetical protein